MRGKMKQRGILPVGLIIYGVITLVALGAIYGIYRSIDHSWETTAGIARGAKDKQAEWDAAVAAQREADRVAAETASTKLENGNAKERVVYRTINKSIDRYIDRPVYRNLCLDDDGLRDAQRAILGKEIVPPGKPDKPVPATTEPRRRDGGVDLKMDRAGL